MLRLALFSLLATVAVSQKTIASFKTPTQVETHTLSADQAYGFINQYLADAARSHINPQYSAGLTRTLHGANIFFAPEAGASASFSAAPAVSVASAAPQVNAVYKYVSAAPQASTIGLAAPELASIAASQPSPFNIQAQVQSLLASAPNAVSSPQVSTFTFSSPSVNLASLPAPSIASLGAKPIEMVFPVTAVSGGVHETNPMEALNAPGAEIVQEKERK